MKALSCPSDSEAKSLRKSARNLTQRGNGGGKSSAEVKNRKNGKKSVGNRTGDGIEGMIEGEIGKGVGEVASGGRSDRIDEGSEDRVGDSCCEDVKEGRDRKVETFGGVLAAWRGVIWCAVMFVDRCPTLVVLE